MAVAVGRAAHHRSRRKRSDEHSEGVGAAVEIPRDAGGLCIIRGSKDAVLHAKELIEGVAGGLKFVKGCHHS